jgi:molybdate transport system substrate-binding protein
MWDLNIAPRRGRVAAGLAGVAVLLWLLGGEPARPAAAPARQLVVFAAASLTEPFTTLGTGFEQRFPGTHIVFDFGGSPELAEQIVQGARADVFASADERWMESLRGRGVLSSAARIFARNRLVVALPRTNPGKIESLADLARPGIKLVLAADPVPAGRYARIVLSNLSHAPGMDPDFARRALANVVSEEENVKLVLAKVRLGEADAGFVYRSDVPRSAGREITVLEIPDRYNVVARYPIAVLRGGDTAAGARFVALVLSPRGQQVLSGYGFIPAGAP